MWQSLSKIKNLASSIHDKERKCTNKKVVLEKKKPKPRSNELYVNHFFDAVQPNIHISNLSVSILSKIFLKKCRYE